jgi:hypothetical protein
MIEIAPRVEELSGLRIPRRHGHMIHPRIKWVTGECHGKYYGFYRPDRPKTIYLNAHYTGNFICPKEMTQAVIAHEYTHYLQDLHWGRKRWNDIQELERFAYEVENHFVPEGYKIDIDRELTTYGKKGEILDYGGGFQLSVG